jgi:hypothetical protein
MSECAQVYMAKVWNSVLADSIYLLLSLCIVNIRVFPWPVVQNATTTVHSSCSAQVQCVAARKMACQSISQLFFFLFQWCCSLLKAPVKLLLHRICFSCKTHKSPVFFFLILYFFYFVCQEMSCCLKYACFVCIRQSENKKFVLVVHEP